MDRDEFTRGKEDMSDKSNSIDEIDQAFLEYVSDDDDLAFINESDNNKPNHT